MILTKCVTRVTILCVNSLQISIRDLHARTGHFVRKASSLPIIITDNGKPVAEINALQPGQTGVAASGGKSYWANRKLLPGFKKLVDSGALKPKPGQMSIDAILDEVKADSTA